MNYIRIAVTFLSLGTLVAYGYALAGLGGYLIGRGSNTYITFGLIIGTLLGGLALYLFKNNRNAFFYE